MTVQQAEQEVLNHGPRYAEALQFLISQARPGDQVSQFLEENAPKGNGSPTVSGSQTVGPPPTPASPVPTPPPAQAQAQVAPSPTPPSTSTQVAPPVVPKGSQQTVGPMDPVVQSKAPQAPEAPPPASPVRGIGDLGQQQQAQQAALLARVREIAQNDVKQREQSGNVSAGDPGGSTSFTVPGGYGNYTTGNTDQSQVNVGGQVGGVGVPTSALSLGGNLGGMSSDYLQSADPSSLGFLNSDLMAMGLPSNSGTMANLKGVRENFRGLDTLANMGSNVTNQGMLQHADALYSGLAQGMGGQGMVDAGSLYDNVFQGNGMQSNGVLKGDSTADGQYNAVMNAIAPLQGVMPQESLQNIQANITNLYLQYSDMAATKQVDPGSLTFVDFLRANGAEDWF